MASTGFSPEYYPGERGFRSTDSRYGTDNRLVWSDDYYQPSSASSPPASCGWNNSLHTRPPTVLGGGTPTTVTATASVTATTETTATPETPNPQYGFSIAESPYAPQPKSTVSWIWIACVVILLLLLIALVIWLILTHTGASNATIVGPNHAQNHIPTAGRGGDIQHSNHAQPTSHYGSPNHYEAAAGWSGSVSGHASGEACESSPTEPQCECGRPECDQCFDRDSNCGRRCKRKCKRDCCCTGADGATGDQGPPGADGTGIFFAGECETGVCYAYNDVIKCGGCLFASKQYDNCLLPQFDPDAWTQLICDGKKGDTGDDGKQGDTGSDGPPGQDGTGIFFAGDCKLGICYSYNDVIQCDGCLYASKQYNNCELPLVDPEAWTLLICNGSCPTGCASGIAGQDGTGISFAGPCESGVCYSFNDVISCGGCLYASNIYNNCLLPEFDPTSWTLLICDGDTGADGPTGAPGTGITFVGDCQSGVCYAFNDVIQCDGCLYASKFENNCLLPEFDPEAWTKLICDGDTGDQGPPGQDGTGIFFVGDCESGVCYSFNDVVKCGACLYASNTYDNCLLPEFDPAAWTRLICDGEKGDTGDTGTQGTPGHDGTGIFFVGDCESGVCYSFNDVVKCGACLYASNAYDNCLLPEFDPAAWTRLICDGAKGDTGDNGHDGTGIVFVGDGESGICYMYNDVIRDADGCLYASLQYDNCLLPEFDPVAWTRLICDGEKGDTGDMGDTGAQGIPGQDGTGISFVGDCESGVCYLFNDVIKCGGCLYASNTYDNCLLPEFDPVAWTQLICDGATGHDGTGIVFVGDGESGICYMYNDVIRDADGCLYASLQYDNCLLPEFDPTAWTKLICDGEKGDTGDQGPPGQDGTGITFVGECESGVCYAYNDVIQCGECLYASLQYNNCLLPEFDPSAWTQLICNGDTGDQGPPGQDGTGITFLGDCESGICYAYNDVVQCGGCLYVSNMYDNCLLPEFDPASWTKLICNGDTGADGKDGTGITFVGDAESGTCYMYNDIIRDADGCLYASLEYDNCLLPEFDPTAWVKLICDGQTGDKGDTGAPGENGDDGTGITFMGDCQSGTCYEYNDVIKCGACLYASIVYNNCLLPEFDPSAWTQLICDGEKGDTGDQGATGEDGKDGKDGQDGKDGTGITFMGDCQSGVCYEYNDVVKCGPCLYSSNIYNNCLLPDFDPSAWTQLICDGKDGKDGDTGASGADGQDGTGITFLGPCQSGICYNYNDVISCGDCLYASNVDNNCLLPEFDPASWTQLLCANSAAECPQVTFTAVAATALTATVATGWTETIDTDAGLNPVTGKYTVPVGRGGYWIVNAKLTFASLLAVSVSPAINLRVNNIVVRTTTLPVNLSVLGGLTFSIAVRFEKELKANDVIDVTATNLASLTLGPSSGLSSEFAGFLLKSCGTNGADGQDGTGIFFVGDCQTGTCYEYNDVVLCGDCVYASKFYNNCTLPQTDPSAWTLLVCNGEQGPPGQNAAISSVFVWSNASQPKVTDNKVPVFQQVALEQNPLIGPTGNGWSRNATNTNALQSTSSGFYLMTYKIDLRTNSTVTANYTRAGACLMLGDGKTNVQITGSGSSAQAPDTIHQYSISNTVLVQYTVGQLLTLQWWAGYYNGTPAALVQSVAGLSVGPNAAAAELPWIPAALPLDVTPFVEATASLVITRIVQTP